MDTERVKIRGTTLSASRAGLGTHALHRLVSSAARQRLLQVGYELGVRYFDTAPLYGAGIAERELGRFLPGRRSDVVLSTKFGIPSGRLAAVVPGWIYAKMALRAVAGIAGIRRQAGAPPRDYSSRSARESVENSLRTLKTDHIDILYLHEPALSRLHDLEGLQRTLESLQAAGKVRYVGLSGQSEDCAQIARAAPSLAQIRQIEIPRGVDGSPLEHAPVGSADVSFWEFAGSGRGARPGDLVDRIVRQLRATAPEGISLVSTNDAPQLRDAVESIGKMAPAPGYSATAALA